jgi:HEPN domain-containing protein
MLFTGIMPANRSRDWWTQARHDLHAARENARLGIHDWACFMAQQAAEKAFKALIQHAGGDAWGHSVRELAALLPDEITVPGELHEGLVLLDRYYIPTRYPNGIASGTPAETYGAKDAETAVGLSEQVLRFVEGHLPRPIKGN